MLLCVLIYIIGGNIYLLVKYYTILNKQESYWLKLYENDIPKLVLEAILWPISYFIWVTR